MRGKNWAEGAHSFALKDVRTDERLVDTCVMNCPSENKEKTTREGTAGGLTFV